MPRGVRRSDGGGRTEGVPKDEERKPDTVKRPQYQAIAEELLSQPLRIQELPSAGEIARRYRVPLPTAQFARRAVTTRVRAPASMSAGGLSMSTRRPAWRQVADDVRDRIETGQLFGRLPDCARLAAHYGVGAEVVIRATRQLERDVILEFTFDRRDVYVHPRFAARLGSPGKVSALTPD